MKFSGVTILQGVEFSIFLLISELALQQCSASALPVITVQTAKSVAKASNELLRAYRLVLGTRSGPALASHNRRYPTPDSAGRNGKRNVRITRVVMVQVGPGDHRSFQRKGVGSVPEEASPGTGRRQTAGHPGEDSQHRATV